MDSLQFSGLLDLYRRVVSASVVEYLQQQMHCKVHRGVFTAQVVMWLMILQRLHPKGTTAAAVQLLLQGAAGELLQNCRRVREERISPRTGGYCQARQKLPVKLCRDVGREMNEQLRQLLDLDDSQKPRVYLLDGSSLELEHTRELVKHYPPAQNQHGVSHWPVLKIVVLHELESGLAEEPNWGPMYGPAAVSEQELAAACMDRLAAGGVIVGDRNFGVLWVADEARRRNLGVVLRLTEVRAHKLAGGPIAQEGERCVEWRASRWDGGKKHRIAADTTLAGRLIAVRVGRGKSKQWLYLFTTLDWPIEKLVELYGERWKIETDLRSLKQTVRLHHLTAKSRGTLAKELIMAVCAYNLVRAVICLASRKIGTNPRQLSFSMVLNVVDCAWPKLVGAATVEEFQREFARVLKLAGQCRLPQRTRKSYPRLLWRHQPGFPFRKGEN